MGKKSSKPKERSDAERRARQCERLSRHLRVLHCILGPARWDAGDLAKELEVSPRTIHRILQTLAMANIPWYYCKVHGCYRVREGFKFPGLDPGMKKLQPTGNSSEIQHLARKILGDLEKVTETLRHFCRALETPPRENEG